jgi:hypothetical protein
LALSNVTNLQGLRDKNKTQNKMAVRHRFNVTNLQGLVIQQKANDKWRFGAVKCHELTRAA